MEGKLSKNNALHNTVRQSLAGSTKNVNKINEKEAVKAAVKNYQKQKMMERTVKKKNSYSGNQNSAVDSYNAINLIFDDDIQESNQPDIKYFSNRDEPTKEVNISFNGDNNEYQDDEETDENTINKRKEKNWNKGLHIHSGHKYQIKKHERHYESSDFNEQGSIKDEKQEQVEKTEIITEMDQDTAVDDEVFTKAGQSADYQCKDYADNRLMKHGKRAEANKVTEKVEIKQIDKPNKKAASKKKMQQMSKSQKTELLERTKSRHTGDGSIDKDNEANAIIDSAAKAWDLKVTVPQTVVLVEDKTVSATMGTVDAVHQTVSGVKKSVTDARAFANKVNGLVRHGQNSGVHKAEKKDSKNLYEKNRTTNNNLRNASNTKKNSKDKKNKKANDKKSYGMKQDVRRAMIRAATKQESDVENNMSTGTADFAKGEAKKIAVSKAQALAAKAGKAAVAYSSKLIVTIISFVISMVIHIVTLMMSLLPMLLLPILAAAMIIGLFSYFFGGADTTSADTQYLSTMLNAKYDSFENSISRWERNNKHGASGYKVFYVDDCTHVDNFHEVLSMYIVFSVEADAKENEYLFIDTNEEAERLNKAFDLFNTTFTTDEGKTLNVCKKTYQQVCGELTDDQKDYYALALEAFSMGADEGYAIDQRIVGTDAAQKALENSPQGTLPMSYEKLKEVFTWMNDDNVYPIDDGNARYVTSQYTLARTDLDENHTTHYGVDFTSEQGVGTKLVAIADATIYKIVHAENDSTGYGNHIILRFDDGTYALYAHMNDFITQYGSGAEYDDDGYEIKPAIDEKTLNEGDVLSAGDPVGHMGNTGDSFGAHLHLVLSTDAYGSGNGSRYDFNDYVACVWVSGFDYNYDY